MKLFYFSAPHILMLLAAIWLLLGFYLLLHKKSARVQRAAIFFLSLLNLFQHILKAYIWPHMAGTGFSYYNTAYNLCAVLIYLTPLSLLWKKAVLRDAVTYIGTVGPTLTMLVPYWFQGQEFLQWEVLRFFTCHTLLILTSLLPLLLGLHRPDPARAPLLPFLFFGMLAIMLLNDVICCYTGLLPSENVFSTLLSLNPCWSMRPAPPQGFEWAAKALELLSPKIFLGRNGRPYIPILWYAVPMYELIFSLAFLFGKLSQAAWKRREKPSPVPANAI